MAADKGRTGEPDVLDRPIDWERAERSPEFRELIAARRRFVIPATIFFLAWYLGFILLCAYAPDFMGERVYQGLTVGYCLALTQFAMVFVLGIMYLRRADRDYDPLAARVVELDQVSRQQQVDEGHFPTLDDVPTQAVTVTIPRLLNARCVIASVPGREKRAAVEQTLTHGPDPRFPGTALKTHPDVHLYVDEESNPDA